MTRGGNQPRKSYIGIRMGIILLIAVILVPVILLTFQTANESFEATKNQIKTNTTDIARLASNEYSRIIGNAQQMLVSLALLPEIQSQDPADCNRLLPNLIQRFPEYSNLGVVRADGIVSCSSSPDQNGRDLSNLPWFAPAIHSANFYTGEYQVRRASQKAVMVLAQPIVDGNGKITSLVTAELSLDWLSHLAVDIRLNNGSSITLIDRDGIVLSHYPEARNTIGLPLSDSTLLALIHQNKSGTYETPSAGKDQILYAFSPLNAANSAQNTYVVVALPLTPAINAIYSSAFRSLIILAFVIAFLIPLVWFITDRFFTQKLNQIISTAHELSRGNLSARTGILTRRMWEIPFLAKTFDEMAQALQDQQTAEERARVALQESEARYRRLTENAKDIIFRYDLLPTPGFSYVNPACEAITGYTQADHYALGSKINNILLHPDDADLYEQYLTNPSQFSHSLVMRWITKQGNIIWIEQRIVHLFDAENNIIAVEGIVHDITALKRSEQSLFRHAREVETLNKIAMLGTQATSQDELIAGFTALIGAAPGLGSYGVLLWDTVTGQLLAHPSYFNNGFPLPVTLCPPDRGIAGKVYVTGVPICSGDVNLHPDYVCTDPSTRSELCVPITVNGQIIGVINLESAEINHFDPPSERLMITIASELSTSLEKVRLYEETQRRLDHLLALRKIDLAITSSFDLHSSLAVLLEQTCANLHADAANILLWDETSRTFSSIAHKNIVNPPENYVIHVPEDSPNPLLKMIHSPQPVFLPDMRVLDNPYLQPLVERGLVSAYMTPLLSKGKLRGILQTFFSNFFSPDDEWKDFLEALAGQAAIALDNAELFQRLESSNHELTLAYDETIEGWSRALDLRDRETEGHSQRVTALTLALAHQIGIPEAQWGHLRRGALLHDIGKVGVPDSILLKPGALSDEEWVVMHRHPDYALVLLSPIQFLRPALDIPCYHHEKWDGTGYPRGLKGEEIPLGARIFAVIDVWDALRSDRPYRKAWSVSDTRSYILRLSGTHFDQAVVSAFFDFMDSPAGDAFVD